MPEKKSKQDDTRAASPIPQNQDDELEMADDDADADFDEGDDLEDDNQTDGEDSVEED